MAKQISIESKENDEGYPVSNFVDDHLSSLPEEEVSDDGFVKSSKPMNEKQRNHIMDFMERHSLLQEGKLIGNNSSFKQNELWKNVALSVSKLGPSKDPTQVKDFWNRQKSKAKDYNASKVLYYRRTGNNVDGSFQLDPVHERVLKIVGNSHHNGLNFGRELGLKRAKALPSTGTNATKLPQTAYADSNSLQTGFWMRIVGFNQQIRNCSNQSVKNSSSYQQSTSTNSIIDKCNSIGQEHHCESSNESNLASSVQTKLKNSYSTKSSCNEITPHASNVPLRLQERKNVKLPSKLLQRPAHTKKSRINNIKVSNDDSINSSDESELDTSNMSDNMLRSLEYTQYAASWSKKHKFQDVALKELQAHTQALNGLASVITQNPAIGPSQPN